jgi:DNA-3-methyladenine glycosylase
MPGLNRDFFLADAVTVARLLPGMDIVLADGGSTKRYIIRETEAYLGTGDRACHASKGRTRRTEVMYMQGGHLYLYFVYGMHWMMNVVTGPADDPQAVLIRAAGEFTGPGRVTKGTGLDGSFNAEDIVSSGRIWIEDRGLRPHVTSGPRVGIDYAGEPWISKPWRFMITEQTKMI